jgi:hypothetical protein
MSPVDLQRRGHVAVVTLDRPDNANVLDLPMGRGLLEAALSCARDPLVRAVVLTGAGRNFCFGGDLRGMIAEGGAVDAHLRELTSFLHQAIAHFVRMDAPVIAAFNYDGGWKKRDIYVGEPAKNAPADPAKRLALRDFPKGTAGTGLQMTAIDMDKDGDLDIVAPGKSGLYWFENLSKSK